MNEARFKKGQKIYRAVVVSYIDKGTRGDRCLCFVYAVFEMVVESCGKKRVAFCDKKVSKIMRSMVPECLDLCETEEMAFARVATLIEEKKAFHACAAATTRANGHTWEEHYKVHPIVNPHNREGFMALSNQLGRLD